MSSAGLTICATDGTGFNLFDYRWMARFGRGKEMRVVSVMSMVYQVIAYSQAKRRKVQNLYVNGHGAAGFQSVGAGTGWDDSGEKSIQLDDDYERYFEPSLKGIAASIGLIELSGVFADNGMITLLGCKVAAEAKGKNLVRAVSRTMGIWVRACDATQYAWLPGYEGQVWYCSPWGALYRGDELYS